jgi:hypothetical protein
MENKQSQDLIKAELIKVQLIDAINPLLNFYFSYLYDRNQTVLFHFLVHKFTIFHWEVT